MPVGDVLDAVIFGYRWRLDRLRELRGWFHPHTFDQAIHLEIDLVSHLIDDLDQLFSRVEQITRFNLMTMDLKEARSVGARRNVFLYEATSEDTEFLFELVQNETIDRRQRIVQADSLIRRSILDLRCERGLRSAYE